VDIGEADVQSLTLGRPLALAKARPNAALFAVRGDQRQGGDHLGDRRCLISIAAGSLGSVPPQSGSPASLSRSGSSIAGLCGIPVVAPSVAGWPVAAFSGTLRGASQPSGKPRM
jgi:hypothetical protein